MANTPAIIFMLYSILAVALASSAAGNTAGVDNTPKILQWLKNHNAAAQENYSVLRFYLHDVVVRENQLTQTVYNVTQPAIPDSTTWFGLIQVVDHRITAGQEYNSEQVGRVQGLHILCDLNLPAISMTWNFIFNDGSTISILGRIESLADDGVLSIVGGTGRYLMARGVAVKKTLTRDSATLNSVQEYTMYVYSSFPPGFSLE